MILSLSEYIITQWKVLFHTCLCFLTKINWNDCKMLVWPENEATNERISKTDIGLADMINDTTVFCKWISLNSLNSINLQLQTTPDRYLSRGSDKKFIFTTSPGNIVTARHRAYLVTIQVLHFKEII